MWLAFLKKKMPVLRGEEPEGGRDGGPEVAYVRIRRKVAQKESYNVSYFAGIKKNIWLLCLF